MIAPRGAHLTTPPRGVVGVLGGMGPLATIDFLRKMLDATPAATDQEHVPVVVSSIPQIPDRPRAFRGEGPSPLPAMIASAERLVAAGAGLIVMPCNTAHLWFDELQRAVPLPMLHMVDAALEEAEQAVGASERIGLLATEATLASRLYLDRVGTDGRRNTLQWLLPTAAEMRDQVTPGIAAVKSGDLARAASLLAGGASALAARGASAVVIGCTEIPLALSEADAGVPLIDASSALARRAVAWSMRV
jgi:aspartate racemase